MSDLGFRSAIGAAPTTLYPNRIVPGAWVVRFPVADLAAESDFEIYQAVALGPGGYAVMYLDDVPCAVNQNGKINDMDSVIFVRKGQEVSLHWSVLTAPAPKVWIWLRTPEVGRI